MDRNFGGGWGEQQPRRTYHQISLGSSILHSSSNGSTDSSSNRMLSTRAGDGSGGIRELANLFHRLANFLRRLELDGRHCD